MQICDASTRENNGKAQHVVYLLFGCTQSKCGRENSAWKAYSFQVPNLMNGQPEISSESSNTSQVKVKEVKEVKSKELENNIAKDKKNLEPSPLKNSSSWDVDSNWGTTDQSNDSFEFEVANWSVSDEAQKSVPDDNASLEKPSVPTVKASAKQKLISELGTSGRSNKFASPRQSKTKSKSRKQKDGLKQIDECKPSTWIADSSDDEHDLFSSEQEENSGDGYSDLLSQLDTALDLTCNDTKQKRASNTTTDDNARYVPWKTLKL